MDDIDSVVIATGPVLFAAVNQPDKWIVDALGAAGKPVVRVTSGGGTGARRRAGRRQPGRRAAPPSACWSSPTTSCPKARCSTRSRRSTTPSGAGSSRSGSWASPPPTGAARMKPLGHTEEAAAMVAVKNRKNAMRNPYAHVKKEVTVDDVMNSKLPLLADQAARRPADLRRRLRGRARQRGSPAKASERPGVDPRHGLHVRGRERDPPLDAPVRAADPGRGQGLQAGRHHQPAPPGRRRRGAGALHLLRALVLRGPRPVPRGRGRRTHRVRRDADRRRHPGQSRPAAAWAPTRSAPPR